MMELGVHPPWLDPFLFPLLTILSFALMQAEPTVPGIGSRNIYIYIFLCVCVVSGKFSTNFVCSGPHSRRIITDYIEVMESNELCPLISSSFNLL